MKAWGFEGRTAPQRCCRRERGDKVAKGEEFAKRASKGCDAKLTNLLRSGLVEKENGFIVLSGFPFSSCFNGFLWSRPVVFVLFPPGRQKETVQIYRLFFRPGVYVIPPLRFALKINDYLSMSKGFAIVSMHVWPGRITL